MRDILNKLNYIFDHRQKAQMGLLLVAIFIGAVFELGGVSLILPLIQLISTPEVVEEPGIVRTVYRGLGMKSVTDFFIVLVVIIICVYLVKNIYLTLMYYFQYRYIYRNQLKCAGRLIDCYLKKPYTYHLDHNTSNMIRNIMLDTDRLFQLILQVLNVISEALLSLLLIIFLIITDPVMSITVALILVVFMGAFRLLTRKRVNSYGLINQTYDGKMHQSINQALGAVKDIKILHREKYFVDTFVSCGDRKMNALINTNFLGQVPKFLIETVCVAAIMTVLAVKLKSGENLNAVLPKLAAFAVAAFKLLPSVGKITNYLNGITFLKPSIDLIYHDIRETEDMLSETGKTEQDVYTGDDVADCISLEDISYRYPNSEELVLDKVSFKIPLGQSVGLIGPSGAGKSTLADCLLGILTPVEGRVMYGKMNVHEYPYSWSRKLASLGVMMSVPSAPVFPVAMILRLAVTSDTSASATGPNVFKSLTHTATFSSPSFTATSSRSFPTPIF